MYVSMYLVGGRDPFSMGERCEIQSTSRCFEARPAKEGKKKRRNVVLRWSARRESPAHRLFKGTLQG